MLKSNLGTFLVKRRYPMGNTNLKAILQITLRFKSALETLNESVKKVKS